MERKRHNFVKEKLQKAKDKWTKDRTKQLNFINRRLRENNEAKSGINKVDEAMFEYSHFWNE